MVAESYEEILKDLKNKIFSPLYFLAGDEAYYIDLITDYIEEKVLDETEKAFNQIIVYGNDVTPAQIIDIARRYPMMAAHLVVIVKEAQVIKKIDDLAVYIKNPQKSTILVINYKYKTLDKRTKFYKTIVESGVYFESNRLRDYEAPGWIERHLMQKGIKAEPDAGRMLTEYLGTDLHKIVNELEKLMITLPIGKPVITLEHIEKNIGISKDFNNFELQKAIGERNSYKAALIIKHFEGNPRDNPVNLTIASLFGYFSKILTYHYLTDKSKNNVAAALGIHPFFVREYESAAAKYDARQVVEIISLLRTYDMKTKGFGDMSSSPADLLRELVFRIINISR
ncbi:MAG: DNA polymerase III subunit delta [Bacteroidales bacterium]